MTIKLVDPLEAGGRKKLIITTKRPIPDQSGSKLTFGGFALASAHEQSGAVGIAQTGDLSIHPTFARGLRRIDPRELPADLRVRPGMVLAYSFVDQPFDLTLRVEPSPPLVRAEARTTVSLSAGRRGSRPGLTTGRRGRLFELKVGLPPGMELEVVGPEEVVETLEQMSGPADARHVTVGLKPTVRDQGAFAIRLVGRQTIDPSSSTRIGLFHPWKRPRREAGSRL